VYVTDRSTNNCDHNKVDILQCFNKTDDHITYNKLSIYIFHCSNSQLHEAGNIKNNVSVMRFFIRTELLQFLCQYFIKIKLSKTKPMVFQKKMYTPVFYSPTDSLLSGIRNDTSLVGIVLQLDANALNSYYVRLTSTIFTRYFTDFTFS
jgi:hypothetical protein